MNPDGSSGQSETVTIRVESIGPQLILVTWQEGDKTTVVHVEDMQTTLLSPILRTRPELRPVSRGVHADKWRCGSSAADICARHPPAIAGPGYRVHDPEAGQAR
jgi:hypothetical protein